MLFARHFLYKVAFDEDDIGAQKDRIIMDAMDDVSQGRNPADRYVPPKPGPIIETRKARLNRKYPVGVPTKGNASDSLDSEDAKDRPVTAINMGALKDYPEVGYLIRSMGGNPNDPKVKAGLEKYWRMRADERRTQYNKLYPLITGRWSSGPSADDRDLPLILPHYHKFEFIGSGSFDHYRNGTPSLINIFNGEDVGPHPLGGTKAGFAETGSGSMIAAIPRRKGESEQDWIARALLHSITTHELGHLLTYPQYYHSADDWKTWITPRLKNIGMTYHPQPTYDPKQGGYMFYTPHELTRFMSVLKMGMLARGKELPDRLTDFTRGPNAEYEKAKKELDALDNQLDELTIKQQDAANDPVLSDKLAKQRLALLKRWTATRERKWDLERSVSTYTQLQGLPDAVNDDEGGIERLTYILDQINKYKEGVRNGTTQRNRQMEEIIDVLNSAYRSADAGKSIQRQQLDQVKQPGILNWAEPYARPTAIG